MQNLDNLVSPAGSPNSAAGRRRPAFHFSWSRFAEYRVMAHLKDHSAMLITLAMTRHEAVAKAKAYFRQEVRRRKTAAGSTADQRPKDERDNVLSVYTERWVGSPTEGCWELLGSRQGGFVRDFFPVRSHNGKRRRGVRWHRREDVKRALQNA